MMSYGAIGAGNGVRETICTYLLSVVVAVNEMYNIPVNIAFLAQLVAIG